MNSKLAVILVVITWLILGGFYYPKWKKSWSEAAISWDVSGYYHYLPALFIYHDIKQQEYMAEVNKKYLPSPAYDQYFYHTDSGNKVNKYAIGQAVLYLPFFIGAHCYVQIDTSYPPDGYSLPYQLAIWSGGILISILGLVLLRQILLRYFEDKVIGWVLLAVALCTNWLEYAAISNGMNHTWLFTLLCAFILFVIRFYRKHDWYSAAGMGVTLGLAVLTRPTEIIWILIPVLWQANSLKERWGLILSHWKKLMVTGIFFALILSIQVIYWKYVSGEWIVYSYGDQQFNWTRVKVWRGLFGANVGWWLYTPLMLLTMAGWIFFYKRLRREFWAVFGTSLLAIYMTLSWPYWEQGGGLGQRNLIQIYPLLAFPLASLISYLLNFKSGRIIWICIFIANLYYTGWWVHQAHKGGFFYPGQMNYKYLMNVLGRVTPDRDYVKLLDTDEYFKGNPEALKPLYLNDFESDSSMCQLTLSDGSRAICLNADIQLWGPVDIPLKITDETWLRVEGDFTMISREWDAWKFAQLIVQFYHNNEVVKSNMIRLQMLAESEDQPTHVFFDVRLPDKPFDTCKISIRNAGSQQTLAFDNLLISTFKNKK